MTKSIVVEALELAEKQFVREGYAVTGPARTSVAKAIRAAEIEGQIAEEARKQPVSFLTMKMQKLLYDHSEATKP